MRRLTLGWLLLVAAACAQAPGGTATATLDWRTSVLGDDLLVELADRRGAYRVEKVSLVAPSGRSFPAYELTRRTVRDGDGYYGRPSVGIGGGFGSSGWRSTGVGVSVPLGGSASPDVAAHTEARIALPPAPQSIGPDWKILVEVTDRSGTLLVAELPAPDVAR